MTGSVKPPPELKKRVLTPRQLRQRNFTLGARGESQAISFLKNHHYRVLATNVSFAGGEIDIVGIDEELNELVFFEIKTRSTAFFGDPSLAVKPRQLKALQKVAQKFRVEHQLDLDYRFDIISILPNSIEHFQNVTWSSRK